MSLPAEAKRVVVEPQVDFLDGAPQIGSRVVCPRCSGRRNARVGNLEDVWYFSCTLCGRDFRIGFTVEDVDVRSGRL